MANANGARDDKERAAQRPAKQTGEGASNIVNLSLNMYRPPVLRPPPSRPCAKRSALPDPDRLIAIDDDVA